MSNHLAIATVTATLRQLLHDSVSSDVDGTTVAVLPPNHTSLTDDGPALNLFLYRVAPHGALRNADLPTRAADGRLSMRPQLALELHYLLTAYGPSTARDPQAHRVLGSAVRALHAHPVLTRRQIRGVSRDDLSASDLAEQVEMVHITPQELTLDDLSKLWSAFFQTPYRISLAYQASVVLIESEMPARALLPVLTRGPVDPATGRERGALVQPTLLSPYPALEVVTPPSGQPAVRMGELLTLTGRNLDGDSVAIRFAHLRSGREIELAPESGATAARVQVLIPPDPPPAPPPVPESPLNPEHWQAGIHGVKVVVRRAGEPDRVTNTVPVVLAPTLTSLAVTHVGAAVTVRVGVTPAVRRSQRAWLVVGMFEVPARSSAGERTNDLAFTSEFFPSGEQWVRLRVDEAESLLVDRSAVLPVFDASQRVTIP